MKMEELAAIPHKEIVHQKLNDEQLRTNLSNAMHTLQRLRGITLDKKFNDWEGLRSKAEQVKNNALMSLKERLEEFEKNATANGIQVHYASSDKDACEIIYQIMKDNHVEKIMKGKSMASEEIGLNSFLESKGLKAVETDMGELIIQLNDEPPTHIVAPAVHRNRYEVGQIFHDKLGASKESDIEKLNAISRSHLRNQFESLKMGMSGVNFALSKEGAIWLIENEGNGRMCTTAPDIHVALCGIEKVIESFEDAATLVHLITPSTCGQFIPTYNNIITGPRKADELDGPTQVHVVIFDHNRSNMLSHRSFYKALRCLRCGACMNSCPVYDKIGGHAYRNTYPGPIGEVISPNLFGVDKTGDVLTFCSQCQRCSEVCPVKIPLANLIRELRSYTTGQGSQPILGYEKVKAKKSERIAFKLFTKMAVNGNLWSRSFAQAHIFNAMIQAFGPKVPVGKQWAAYKDLPKLSGNFYKKVHSIEGVIYE